jgi:Putative zinc dependent peptidase (DUF5700)
MSWDLGIQGRSYYVVGLTMCKLIDERLGRNTLIEVMSTGPRKWVRTYNQLADIDLQLSI